MNGKNGIALVVGGGSGIGRVAVHRWADAGGIAIAADVNASALAETAAGRDQIHRRELDVTKPSAVFDLINEIESDFGPIDRAYNCAAIQPTDLLLNQKPDEVHRVMHVNYQGVVNVSLAVLPRLLERGRGALVNFSSIAGWVPNMHFGAYGASKFAVVAFTETLHHENRGRGVDILCVCPGQVDTPLRAQALSKPKIMQTGPSPMSPHRVLDAVERAIGNGSLFVFPGATTKLGWYLRRFAPRVMWRIDHRAEGF
jgi:NAD(P)-dependent dehydrogenase (short-subunit alcohol dehydrogenase family)